MHIEDALELLANEPDRLPNAWAKKFVSDVSMRTYSNMALSSAQASTAVSILRQLSPETVSTLFAPGVVARLIATPTYRQPPYRSTQISRREVRYIGDGKVAFRAKLYDLSQATKSRLPQPPAFLLDSVFRMQPFIHADLNLLVVEVNRHNVMNIVNWIERDRYHCDDATLEFLAGVPNTLYETDFIADGDLGVIVGDVGNNGLVGWIVTDILGGEPV